MDSGARSRLLARMAASGITAVAVVWQAAAGQAADAPRQKSRIEIVRFVDTPVTVVHGASPDRMPSARRETVSFGNGAARPVTIVRGTGEPEAAAPPPPTASMTVERVAFAGAVPTRITILRGTAAMGDLSSAAVSLPATARDLERIAEAVHGVESSYGADPAMWRPDLEGPQGPMQVSAAAAHDTGGGNRFDAAENRLLGRAYLARMFRRYDNWPDALAAYNWGPGNVDRWVAGGRDLARLPLETTRYIGRVLRKARVARSAGDARLPITR